MHHVVLMVVKVSKEIKEPKEILVAVLKEHGTAGMLRRFLKTYDTIDDWWHASAKAHLPMPLQSSSSRIEEWKKAYM